MSPAKMRMEAYDRGIQYFLSPAGPFADKGITILIDGFLGPVISVYDNRRTAFREEFDKTTRPGEYEIVSYEDIVWEERNS